MNLKGKRRLARITELNNEIIILTEMFQKGIITKGVFDYEYERKVKELLDLHN